MKTRPILPAQVASQPNGPTDFRLFLQAELVRRCKANPSYSLRSFARLLEVEPSFLSKILSGKCTLTRATLHRFARRLALSPLEIENFETRLGRLSRSGRKVSSRGGTSSAAAEVDANYRQLTLDHFQVIADWYHYAILELTAVEGFESNSRFVARSLGIKSAEAAAAVERLFRLEHLIIDESGNWKASNDFDTTVGNEFTAVAFRKLQRQILEMAITALEQVPLDRRDQSSMTMAVSTKKLAGAKSRIREFRRELCTFLQEDGPLDGVYQLSVSLFPVMHSTFKGDSK